MPMENDGTPSGGSTKKKRGLRKIVSSISSKLSLSRPEKKQKRDGPSPDEEAQQQATTAGERCPKFSGDSSFSLSRKEKEKKHTGSEEGQQQQQTAAGTGTNG